MRKGSLNRLGRESDLVQSGEQEGNTTKQVVCSRLLQLTFVGKCMKESVTIRVFPCVDVQLLLISREEVSMTIHGILVTSIQIRY